MNIPILDGPNWGQFSIHLQAAACILDCWDILWRIMLNGHSRLSKDRATFMFCSSLPESYEPTTWQYLNNITVIANYKLMNIIAQVLQEESRRKAQSIGQHLSLNKFSTVKNLGQKCVKWTTQLKTTGL